MGRGRQTSALRHLGRRQDEASPSRRLSFKDPDPGQGRDSARGHRKGYEQGRIRAGARTFVFLDRPHSVDDWLLLLPRM